MKLIRTNLIALLLTISPCIYAQSAVMPSGSGTGLNPYEIDSLPNLYWLSQNPSNWNDTFSQTSDIEASATSLWNSGTGLSPIGNHGQNFNGSYNGKGHIIRSLTMKSASSIDLGLFGYTGLNSKIDSLGLVKVHISSTGSGNIGIGAIAGQNLGNISNSFSTGLVSGDVNVGGITGINWSIISNSYSIDSVGGYSFMGGIAGTNSGIITSCYAAGLIIGGNRSTIVGNSTVGGIAGENSWKIISSYWDVDRTSLVIPIGYFPYGSTTVVTDAYGLTDSAMQNLNSYSGWDFSSVWYINLGKSYPLLKAFIANYTAEDLIEGLPFNEPTLTHFSNLKKDISLTPVINATSSQLYIRFQNEKYGPATRHQQLTIYDTHGNVVVILQLNGSDRYPIAIKKGLYFAKINGLKLSAFVINQ